VRRRNRHHSADDLWGQPNALPLVSEPIPPTKAAPVTARPRQSRRKSSDDVLTAPSAAPKRLRPVKEKPAKPFDVVNRLRWFGAVAEQQKLEAETVRQRARETLDALVMEQEKRKRLRAAATAMRRRPTATEGLPPLLLACLQGNLKAAPPGGVPSSGSGVGAPLGSVTEQRLNSPGGRRASWGCGTIRADKHAPRVNLLPEEPGSRPHSAPSSPTPLRRGPLEQLG